jgi:DNA polymerase-1
MLGFREVWCCDFEFGSGQNGIPSVVCMVAREFITGKKIRLWRHQLYSLSKAPFDTGPNSLFVAYSAGAEISCFIALHWSIPLNILDLYTEYLAFTNGRRDKKSGTSLLCAMEHYRLGHLTPAEKDAMRALAMRSGPWTRQETASLLDYCAEDVDALCRLLPPMAAELALRPAPEWLFRGRAMAAMQCIEMNGIPLDAPMLEEICTRRLDIIARLTGQLEARYGYGIWQGTHWRHGAFREWTRKVGLKWPSTSSGLPTTDDRTFRRMILSHPRIPLQPLHECCRSVELLSKFEIAVDADGRSRCWLAPFRSESGRNQPSNSRFVFGAPSWMRHLIKPPPGWGVAYVDWSAQEIAIAAGLSGDEHLLADYATGDIYLNLAIRLGLAPAGASKATHPEPRARCKVVMLATNYGQTEFGLARTLDIGREEARELLRGLAHAYPRFNAWKQSIVNASARPTTYYTRLGWPWWSGHCRNKRTVMNHPAQSNGSDMMRLAAVAAVEAGIKVCAPVHDAFLIAAPVERLEEDVEQMIAIMRKAGERICGIPCARPARRLSDGPIASFRTEAKRPG